MEAGASGAAQIKTSALEVAAEATVETAGDAARHVLSALQHYTDDPDLTAALADLQELAPEAVADATEQHELGGAAEQPAATDQSPHDDGGLAEQAADAPGLEPDPDPVPAEPVEVAVPAHGPDDGGWPNDWPEFQFSARIRAKQMPDAFLTPDGQRGRAGDYYIISLDVHGEPRATSPFAVMAAETFATVYEQSK